MSSVEWVGTLGALSSCSAILPQIYKSYKSGSTKDLSWSMFAMFYVGVILNTVFGFLIGHPAIYVAGIYSFITNSVLVAIKVSHEWPREHPPEGAAMSRPWWSSFVRPCSRPPSMVSLAIESPTLIHREEKMKLLYDLT